MNSEKNCVFLVCYEPQYPHIGRIMIKTGKVL